MRFSLVVNWLEEQQQETFMSKCTEMSKKKQQQQQQRRNSRTPACQHDRWYVCVRKI